MWRFVAHMKALCGIREPAEDEPIVCNAFAKFSGLSVTAILASEREQC